MTQTSKIAFVAGFIFATALLAALIWQRPYVVQGSIIETQEYLSTTTGSSVAFGNTITGRQVLKITKGALGSVVITGANTGIVNIYNATTTDVNLRQGNKATSTILIASIPPSAAAGTYTFDVSFSDGLLIDLVAGTMPTTTVTWR